MSPRDHNDAWREDPEAARRDDDNAEVFKPEVIEFPKDRKAGNGNGNGKSPEDDWRKLLITNKSGAPKSQLALRSFTVGHTCSIVNVPCPLCNIEVRLLKTSAPEVTQ